MVKVRSGSDPTSKVKSAHLSATDSKKTNTVAAVTKQIGVGKSANSSWALAKGQAGKAAAKNPTVKGAQPAKAAMASKVRRLGKIEQAASPAHGAKKPGASAAVKSIDVKPTVRRRAAAQTAVQPPIARQAKPSGSVRTFPAAIQARVRDHNAPQVFNVSHLNEADFRADGLRTYAQYRDLGMAAATGGLCQAHVIRMVPPCTDVVRKRHVHQAELQLVYVLKGWMKNEFEGYGEQMMSTGSCWLQPSGIKHTVLDYSPDCEVLEIVVPADFKTEDQA